MNPTQQILQIPIEDIIPNRFQPRISFDEKALSELSASIKQHGIIQPLVVRRLGDKYEIIAGERRYKAATMAGITSVPAVISEMDDQESAEVALVENVQRKDLTAIEEAKSYKNLMEKNNMTQEEVATKMGISQSAVANKLRLLNLSERVQKALLNEQISERHARSLLGLSTPEEQDKWLEKILNERLTVRQLDTLLKNKNIEEEDVPLVNMNQSIEDIRSNATDIIINNDKDLFTPKINTENKFFNILEDEPVKMGPTSPVREVEIPSFDLIQPVEEKIETINEVKLFEDVELLEIDDHIIENNNQQIEEDFSEKVLEQNTENSEKILTEILEENIPEKLDLSNIILDLRDKISSLNINKNISIEELDLEDSYKINITIKKDY